MSRSQSQSFNFALIAQTMLKDKFLVQTVALTSLKEEYPPALAAQLVRDV